MKFIGYVDGIDVKFDFYPPNIFKAEIPKKKSGIYILELHAIDEAGNETNLSDIFIDIDFQKMSMKLIGDTFSFIKNSENFSYEALKSPFDYKGLI